VHVDAVRPVMTDYDHERRRTAPRRELLPLGGQRSGDSRKRGGTPMTPYEPARVTPEREALELATTTDRGTLASTGARLDLAVATCRGLRHAVNEDAHSALDGAAPVFVVADGVGGGAMASRASRELVRRVHRVLDHRRIEDASVRAALLIADHEVARSIASETDELGAATVVLCACEDANLSAWLVAWVGDCRAYRVFVDSDREPELLTRDDTYRHLAETPPPGGSPDDPARMVGNGAVSVPNLAQVALGDDEMLVLCSDGMHKHVDARDISRLLRHGSLPLASRCSRLLVLARTRGSTDDATVLVIHRATIARAAPPPGSGGP
jgi:PPM family protein phosphatase